MSAAGERHMARVRMLPCLICCQLTVMRVNEILEMCRRVSVPLSSAHHCFDTSDRNDFLTIPLCYEHHQGRTGFHGLGERAFNMRYKTSETKLLAVTLELLAP